MINLQDLMTGGGMPTAQAYSADPYAGWKTTGSVTLADLLTPEAYQNAWGGDSGPAQSYEDWVNSYLQEHGVPLGADLSKYTMTTRSSDGSNWGGTLNAQVTQDGQTNPIYSNTWANGGMITPGQIATTALALFGGGALAAGAGGAGAGAGIGAAEGAAPTLAAAETVPTLGAAWSPEALGLTGSLGSGYGAELAALSQGIPGAVGAAALGGAGAGVSSLGSAWSPQSLGLSGGIAPGASAGDISAIGGGLPGAVSIPTGATSVADPYDTKFTRPGGPAELGNIGGASGGAATLPTVSADGSWLDSLGLGGLKDMLGGGQNLASLLGSLYGATQGGKTTTSTVQNQIDPRMAQYLYGSGYGDTNSLLGAAQQYYQQNKSGLNPTMQQGLDMQRAALMDPAYAQSYTQMRDLGNSLMSAPVAANPYTSSAPQTGGLLGPATGRAQNLMVRGRGLIG